MDAAAAQGRFPLRVVSCLHPLSGGGLRNRRRNRHQALSKIVELVGGTRGPTTTATLDKKYPPYELIWQDSQQLAGKSFYLPGSLDADNKEAAAVKAEMAAIRDARDHLHAANEEGMSLHQADTFRTHRSHVNGDIVALLRCGRDIRAEARCSPGCCRAGTVPLVPAAPRPAHLGRRGSSSLLPAQ
ncbi:syntaxin-related protein KNOLLE-like [Panicum miliaceum]|uniref:Syntaxin-related protein KNOLLE-like n=1 Tax=Panicum miliaceum TaxID=4540 RepID=A0A3L6PMX6_PANMI|nr:syntaxin-related protein KNOLLE-like [Panicum miliaceum]